jgi:hypothetical protein
MLRVVLIDDVREVREAVDALIRNAAISSLQRPTMGPDE